VVVAPIDPTPPNRPEPPKNRLRQDRKGMNKTEAEFGEYLAGYGGFNSKDLQPQALGFRLANGCVYWPDWVGVDGNGQHHVWEVKGFMRDDAAVKIKVASRLFRSFHFYLVTKIAKKRGGGWDIQRVLP
jgi:hypothetical protein